MSDSSGFIHDSDGINGEKLEFIKQLKNTRRGRISEYAKEFGCEFHPGARPWGVPGELAFPCATQNELSLVDAKALAKNGCIAVSEGANMPTEKAGIDLFHSAGVLFAPGKAANAGGVAVSGLEMTQNSVRLSWSWQEMDTRLREIMQGIHNRCEKYAPQTESGQTNYVDGANIAGFVKVADAMLAYGVM